MKKSELLSVLELIRNAHSIEKEMERVFHKINPDTVLFLGTEEQLLDLARIFDLNLTNELERFLYEAGGIGGEIKGMIELDGKEVIIDSLDSWLELMIAINIIERD